MRMLRFSDPSLGDPDDDYLTAVLRGLGVDVGALIVGRRPVVERAEAAVYTLAELGLATPVGVGAGDVGREMDLSVLSDWGRGAPASPDGVALAADVLQKAPDGSVHVLVTTSATDVVALIERHHRLCWEKFASLTMQGGAVWRYDKWIPDEEATNNSVDRDAAFRLFEVLQDAWWRSIPVRIFGRHATRAGFRVPREFLDELAELHPVARWLRQRAELSLNELGRDARSGRLGPGRWARFVRDDLDGREPDLAPDEPIFSHVSKVSLHDCGAGLGAVKPRWFSTGFEAPEVPNWHVYGPTARDHGVTDPEAVNELLMHLLREGFSRPSEGTCS